MPEWVTHMMVADRILVEFPQLDRHGFYVGNIAPDCNIQNEDWTSFTPPRAVTHWMQGERKAVSDVDAFCEEYILKRRGQISPGEEYSFLLGYYTHLITDAVFQESIRNKERVAAAWARMKADTELMEKLTKLAEENGAWPEENWDTAKRLLPRDERMREMHSLEAEYLKAHPNSGYLTDIMQLKEFPDYIDYLPHGSIAYKIPYLGSYLPKIYSEARFIGYSREEFKRFLNETIGLIKQKFMEKELI